ncbi:LuxR C-terminal-related transcriptional regulator [soil metagenome]|nr:DNA-binding response regulator [Trueperaceae bacterium]
MTHERTDATLLRAREGFERRAWSETVAALSEAAARTALAPHDLERLAVAAYMSGRDDVATAAMALAHDGYLAGEEMRRASRSAFWLALWRLERGERAHASGWLALAERAVQSAPAECAERGLLVVPVALRAVADGDVVGALALFDEMARIGSRCGDVDVVALARQGQGRALLHLGEVTRGLTHLDEAMLAATHERASPMAVGVVYCSVLDACREIGDVRRAREWTHALSDWCEGQPDLVPYRGQCMVHRAELLRLSGAWPEALQESDRACDWLVGPPSRPGLASAHYVRGEVLRSMGRLDEAEASYDRARDRGVSAQPGIALLHAAQGRTSAAARELDHELRAAHGPVARARLLPACVDTALAAGDVAGGRAAAEELAGIARAFDTPYLQALACRAEGAVALAAGDGAEALTALRGALAAFGSLDISFDVALTRLLEARAHRLLHDAESAGEAQRAAQRTFERLGVAGGAAGVVGDRAAVRGLTSREIEVLGLVATGASNKAVGARLGIRDRTVERHLTNLFAKLGVASRTAATAYAFRHGLIGGEADPEHDGTEMGGTT